MAVYPSIYRAKATRWTGSSLQVLVPQVFGEAPLEVTDFLGPQTTGMGWVFFQGGDPEFPVWTSGLGTGGGGSGTGSGEDWSNEIAALTSRIVTLEGQVASLQAATVTGEVWIGPEQPVDPAVELWYDTDA